MLQGTGAPVTLATPANKHKFNRLGTLGDASGPFTCSMHVAHAWGQAATVEPYNSFENAGLAVKSGDVDAMLVPGAYPNLNELIMDAGLEVSEVFVMRIPPLVLAAKSGEVVCHVERLFHHPATASLLPETDIQALEPVEVTSNVKACEALLWCDVSAACITNALCARHFRLTTIKTLRAGVQMPWICFCRPGDLEAT
jgi:prephenate dehydratase